MYGAYITSQGTLHKAPNNRDLSVSKPSINRLGFEMTPKKPLNRNMSTDSYELLRSGGDM